MVNKKKMTLFVAFFLSGILLFWFFYETETDKVIKAVKHASAKLSKKEGMNNIELAAELRELRSYLADKCVISIPAYQISGEYGRKDLTSHILAAWSRMDHFSAEISDIIVEIPADTQALVNLTVRVQFKFIGSEEAADYLECSCSMQKFEGDWVFQSVEAAVKV